MRKAKWKYTGSESEPVYTEEGPNWTLQSVEFYVRDLSGKEIAIYSDTTLSQWNVFGLDNVGKINSDNKRYFYMKDHLGSVRVVLDTANNVISAQDYDAWGYLLENRTYQSNNTRYKFTEKERDNESNYDYFGARYYDARIGRWGGVEPLLDKYPELTPYMYVYGNPLRFHDEDGMEGLPDRPMQTYKETGGGGVPVGMGIIEVIKDIGTAIWVGMKGYEAVDPSVTNETVKPEDYIISNEQVESITNKIVKETNWYAKGGKQNVKETSLQGKSVKEVEAELKKAKQEGDKKKVQKITRHLKGMKERNIVKRGGKTKFESREDPNN